MELEERLSYLEAIRDWQGLVEALEGAIAAGGPNETKANLHLRLGQVLEQKFLSGVRALKHFQDAYKLNPQLPSSLEAARRIYWDLGKLNMVQKLLELELKNAQPGERQAALLLELGDVLCDVGDYEKATATYARALGASGGQNAEASACLEDVQSDPGTWQERMASILTVAHAGGPAGVLGRLYLRVARILKRFAPADVEAMLKRSYVQDPLSKEASASYEGMVVEAGRGDELVATQREILAGLAGKPERAAAALAFGVRWVLRHQNVDAGTRFLEESVKLDPENEGAFQYLRDVYGKKGGDWERVITLAEEAVTGVNGKGSFIIAQTAVIAWREAGNLIRARALFERLSGLIPDHPQLRAFEAQTGESVSAKKGTVPPPANAWDEVADTTDTTAVVPPSAPAPAPAASAAAPKDSSPEVSIEVSHPPPAPVAAAPQAPLPAPVVLPTPEPPAAAPPPPASAPAAVEAAAPPPPAAPAPAAAAPVADDAKIEELRQTAEKQEAAKRFNEYVKTILALAAIVPDDVEKIDLYTKAADLYVNKFANQAEAVKAYEAILALDPEHDAATAYLRQSYEKRRDWEKLLGLERREAERMIGPARGAKFLEIAKLATERVKKPEVCIELWREVLESDDSNADALTALSALYERSKEFDKLAAVLEKQAETTYETNLKLQILGKLGAIYGDRLNNDDGAVNAWRQVLVLDPNDRKAQEALKKKYLALGLWDDLEVFYAESGKWDEFIRVLEQQEAKETQPEAKIGLLFKIAQLWADKKQKNDRAAKAYEKVLELESNNLRAAEALIPIYTAAANSKALANVIEVKLGHEEEPFAKLGLLREVAALYEGPKVKDPQRAFERYLAAFELSPGDEISMADAERAAKATNGWERLIQAHKAAIDASLDPMVASTLRLRMGRILVEEVSRVDEALEAYRAVYEADTENADAILALERLYRQTSRFDDLLGIYEKKRDLANEQADRRTISYAIAKLQETELRDVDRAIDTYNAVLDDEPQDPEALAALDRLYGGLQRWEPYVDVLRKRIEIDVPEAELVDLKFRLGQTLEKHTGDAPGALENYKEILFVDAKHDAARLALEAMLTHENLRAEAAQILESIYEERGDWERLIGALGILADAEIDLSRRVKLLRKIARISAESLKDTRRAFEALARALKEDPQSSETREEIEKVAADAGSYKDLVLLYEEIARSLDDAALARDYWMRIAATFDGRLDMVDDAARGYGEVLNLDPADQEALSALEQLFTRTERWSDLIGVVERRVEQTVDPEAREALFGQMALIYDARLGRPADAVSCYRKVLEFDPSSTRALEALDALFVRQKMWTDLADNLEQQLALAAEDARIGLMLRLAALRESEMDQVEVAIENYRTVLEHDMGNQAAFAALERLGKDGRWELTIADLLEPLYRQSGDFQKLIGVHEVQVRRSDDVARKVELLHQIAQLYEDAASDQSSAFDTLARALQEDPSNEDSQQTIERLARATSRFADMCKVYDDLAGKCEDTALATSLLMVSARLFEQDIGDVDTAVAHYRRVLDIDARHLPAAEALERLFRQTERYADLSLVLQQKSEILDEPQEKKEALFQAAAIEEDVLEKAEAAILVYQKVLAIDEDDIRALDALIKRYLGLSRWNELLLAFAKKADLVVDPEEKKRILYQVGAVYERELTDGPRSIDTYQRILEIDPDDIQALSRLDVLYEHAENWSDLLGVLQRESEMTADMDEAISFHYRIGELYEKRLDDVPRAVEIYRDILGRKSDHEPTLVALEGLKSGDRDPLGAAAVLEPVYEASSDWPKLISVHEVQVAHATDPFQKVDLLHRISRLYEDALDDHASAFETYARSIVFDNGNEATLTNLERLGSVVNRWPDVAKLYDVELDKLADTPDRLVELGLRVAQIYEVQLEDVNSAIVRYQRVAGVDAENQVAVRALDRLYVQTERWAELAQVLAVESEIGQTPDEILEFKYRLGQVHEKRLGNVDLAIAAYRDVLGAAPEHQATLEALEALFAAGTKQVEIGEILEPLYRQSSEWEKLAKVYEAQLAHIPAQKGEEDALGGQDDRLQAYYRIAELQEERLADPVLTLATYIRALKEYPLDEKSGEEVPRLAGGVDQGFETLANAYADIVALHNDPTVQKTIGRRLAQVYEDQLGDLDRAEETFKYVLSVDRQDTEALANLDRIYLSTENWQALAQILEMRVKAPAEEIELVELYARLGEVYETHLADIPNATTSYRKIFDGLDRTHEGAILALARIYEGQSDWVRLNEVHERELENASGDVAEAEIRAKLAHLAADRLGEPARAIEGWKVVLDLRGEDPEALNALSNLYQGQKAWRELVDVLERLFDIAVEDDDRVNILTRRARVFTDQMSRDDLAIENWSRVLDIDYANLAALRAMAAIRRRQNDPGELVSALHQTVDRGAAMLDSEELKEIFRELGRTYQDQLGQAFDAADAWRKLLDVGPDFEAMDRLETIYRAEERWVDVIDVKMRRADALEDKAKKIEELRSVAGLWNEEAQDPDKATPAWQKVLEAEPEHDEAFRELERLHSSANRNEPLVELYLARLDTREDTAEKTELLRKIAKVFEEKLEDKNQALDALINALQEDIHDRETAKYLERMAQATGRWGEVIQTANNWLQAETNPAQKIRLCLHLAKWYGDDLGHPEYAQPYYAQIVQLDPNNVGALRQMGQLYRKNANWQQLGATLTRALDVAVTPVDRKEILTELGELLDSHMSQTDEAVGYFTRALEIDTHFVPAIENLERIYAARGQSADLVVVLGKKVPALTDPAEIANVKLRIGSLHESMGDAPRASQVYREVVDADPTNLQGLRGLARVYEALEQWAELVKVLEGELEVVSTERERIDIFMHIASLQEEHFLKPDLAAQRLEQLLEIDPNHEEAYVALERNYRKMRQWLELVNAYERHIGATVDRKTKIDLFGAIAQVYSDEAEDVERAIDAYRNIVDLDEVNIPAWEALSKAYDKLGDAAQSIDAMTHVADLTSDTKQRVETFYKIGKALDEKLGDRVQARDRYEQALDLDPSHIPTLGALRQLALDDSDFDKAARYIDQEQSYTAAPRQRARLLIDLGKIREENLGDHESAVLAWEAAYEADPENEESAMPLANDYVTRELWEKAEPLLELLVRKAGKRDRAEQHDLNAKLGKTCAALGKDDKAYRAYSAAHQLDLTDQATIRGLADVCFRLRDWGAALTNLQKVLTSLGEEEVEARADVYYKLGCIKREQGQAKQAINNFEKALGVDPAHRPTLEALVGIYANLKDWKQVVHYKRAIFANLVDADERFKLLQEIGDIWNDNDKSPQKAIEALEEAREIQPENRPLLHKMLALYESTQNWSKMIDTIQIIADMEKDPVRRSKQIFTMAQLFRDKENNLDRAVELFNDALDLNPHFLEAFERINKILNNNKDWKGLERAYRKMLRRLSTATPETAKTGTPEERSELEFNLWHQLGLIYRDRLQNAASAIEAFKMAAHKKPDDPSERQILAELYELTEQLEAAIGEHAIVLQKDPLRVDPYRSLYRLALKMRDYDRAWCMCAALAFLQRADDDEKRFFEDYRPRGMIQVKSRLDNEQWVKNLFHRDENIFVGKIFEMVTPAAVTAKLQALAASKQLPALDRRFKQDPATSTVTFAKTFGWAGQVLGVQLPELYVRNDVPGALMAVAARPPSSVAGQTVLTGFTPQELTFIVGKHLSSYRGEHYIKNIFPTLGELKVVLFSAIKLIMADFQVPPEMAQAVATTAQSMAQFIQPMERDSLRLVVQKFIGEGAKADLKRWMQATDITAARAGLLLCGDLEIAKKIIQAEPQLPGDLPPADKMKELLIFSVSDQYLALRRTLGISVSG